MQDNVLIQVKEMKMYFPVTQGIVRQKKIADIKAVDGVTFSIKRGETMGLVGESGCGKTTTGRCILQLYRPTQGQVIFEGRDLCQTYGEELRRIRRRMQLIFQDPYASLNPRMTAGDNIGEPLKVHHLAKGKEQKKEVAELLRVVGMNPNMADRFPHEFSGGQRQRIGIARALALKPALVVCDEPVSALDVSIQAQTINLLQELQEQFKLTYLFIAHDMAIVRHISDRVAVMYLGKIVEIASRADLYQNPLHPYTKALLSAVPIPDPEVEKQRQRIILTGDVPSPLAPPFGCHFHPRCSMSIDVCKYAVPQLRNIGNDHWVACHLGW
jgi:oligopeptide transport system ATP-binding protein